MNEPMTPAEKKLLKKIAAKGGRNNAAKNGSEHMRRIGALGGLAKGKNKKNGNPSS